CLSSMRRGLQTCTLSPYTTLFRSDYARALANYDLTMSLAYGVYDYLHVDTVMLRANRAGVLSHLRNFEEAETEFRAANRDYARIDRKSTRLNSSHVKISYAVFCLK